MMTIHSNYNDFKEFVGRVTYFDGVVGQIEYNGEKYYFTFENINYKVSIGDYVSFNVSSNEYSIVNNVKQYREFNNPDDIYNEFNEGEMQR